MSLSEINLEHWNLKEFINDSSLKGKPLYYYTYRNGKYIFRGTDELFNKLKEKNNGDIVYDTILHGYHVTRLDEEYDEKKEYLLQDDREIIEFKVTTPKTTDRNVLSISKDEMAFIIKGHLEDQEDLRKHIYKYVEELEPESELIVPKLKYKYISINGISLKSADLRLFYNTWLFDILASTDVQEIELPNLTLSNIKAMRDLFNGNIEFNTFLKQASNYQLAILTGPRTMLDLYDFIDARIMMANFEDTKWLLREQLGKIQFPEKWGKVKRLDELVNVAKE